LSTSATTIRSADGLSLIAEYDGAENATACAVICHAHPRMQGTMKSPLLVAFRDELKGRGYSVLRFNFRGVDGSEGEMGTGIEEVADVLGALEFVDARDRGTPAVLLGWSFGGAVALRVALQHDPPSVCAYVAIAPPVKEKPGVTAALPPPDDARVEVPTLIVWGSNDKVISPTDCREWAQATGARHVEIPAANHFFWAKYDVLVDTVVEWLEAKVEFDRRERA
jgi:alpha/beta superfamily hydrolase